MRVFPAFIGVFSIIFVIAWSGASWPGPARYCDAIFRAEGGDKAARPYGVIIHGHGFPAPAARMICLKTISHVRARWHWYNGPFTAYLAGIYCPADARTWRHNVEYFLYHPAK